MAYNPMYWGKKRIDNVIVHLFPDSPYIIKCSVHLRHGKRIIERFALKDLAAWNMYQTSRNYSFDSIKIINHREAEQ